MLEKILAPSTASRLTLSIKAATIIITTLALFSQDLIIIFSDALQSETTNYLIIIPILFVYLIYRKKKILRYVALNENKNEPKETRHIPSICGVLLSVTAVLLYWHGSYTFMPLEYHMLVLPIFACGLTLILFNFQTLRQLLFPVAFLIFLMPPPSEILYALGSTLSLISSEVSNAIVNVIGIPSTMVMEYANPKIIITRPDGSTFEPIVDIACSGIYSLIGFLIFAVLIAYIIRDKPWKKLAVIGLGIPLIYMLNIIRITTILIIGYYFGEGLALQLLHVMGGLMLIFLGTILLLVISEKIFKIRIFTRTNAQCPQCSTQTQLKESSCLECGKIIKPPNALIHRKDLAKIAIITISIILLVSIQAPVFALTQTSPIVITNTPTGQQYSTEILPEIFDYTLYFGYRDVKFEENAKQDMALVYLYMPKNESKEPVWVAIEIASTPSSLHRWETCLITWPLSHGYQPRVTQIELKDVKLNENPPIIGRYFAFINTNTNETQVVLYWYEKTIFTVNQTAHEKNVKISVIAFPYSIEDLPIIENQLTTIAKTIANYWLPIKTWSQITMIISHNGAPLATATITLLIAMSALYFVETEKQKKANANVYKKLSRTNQQTINTILETQKSVLPTLKNIAATHQKITGKQVDNEQLLRELAELENIGIIKSTISNVEDEPVQTWRANISFQLEIYKTKGIIYAKREKRGQT